MSALLVCTDLLFASRVQGTATAAGTELQLLAGSNLARLEPQPECSLVIIDLTELTDDVAAAVTVIKERCPLAKLIAFGSHVDVQKLAAAKAAGCDHVWARGMFVQQLPGLFGQ